MVQLQRAAGGGPDQQGAGLPATDQAPPADVDAGQGSGIPRGYPSRAASSSAVVWRKYMYPENKLARVRDMLSKFNGPGCYEWPLSKTAAGYGQFSIRIDGRQYLGYAHRAAWEVAFGEIPPGLEVCHKCDNPACMRPDHLFLGSHKENMSDMARKKRSNIGRRFPRGDLHWARKNPARVRGEKNSRAKLTEDDVRYIKQSNESHASLGRKFGVTISAIFSIRRGKSWRHV